MRDDLGARMKENYEERSRSYLLRRTPVAIRIDGKAFHTFTRGFEKPFDRRLMDAMQLTMKYLCENVQGCVIGYTQSDEITLILQDYRELETDCWFDYQVQKICSVAASMATFAFNKFFGEQVHGKDGECRGDRRHAYRAAADKGALFDARCFNVPKEEVANLLYWRQLDAIRNSVASLAQAHFSAKQLHGKGRSAQLEMLEEKGIIWQDLLTDEQRGACCIKERGGSWYIDRVIPIFAGENRSYIERLIFIGE